MAMYPPPQAFYYPPPQQQQSPPQPRHQPAPASAPQVQYRSYGAPSAPPAASTSFYQLDPESFRRDYAARLAELTMNSRPIIQDLSVYAQEYARWSDSVVSCIDKHIRMVPAWMKLPAFYLVDAICKNVYNPYSRAFAPVVAPLFLDTYGQVDEQTRSKMAEMLLTWRTGGPNGRELFGVGPQVAIERGIWGSGPGATRGGSSVSKQQVLSELEFAISQKERALQSSRYDVNIQNTVNVLYQLRALVETGVSQQELAQILGQLRSLVAPAPVPAPVATSPPPPPFGNRPPFPPQHPPYAQAGPSRQPQPPAPVPFQSPPVQVPTPPVQIATPAGPDVSSLFQSLLKSGILSTNNTPIGAGATAKPPTPERKTANATPEEERRAYRAAIMSESIAFSSADITRNRPGVPFLLYDRLPAQCGQCGVRFSESPSGKKKMQDHLDDHFRANRQAEQPTGRGHSRNWFITADDWLCNASGKGKGRADGRRLNKQETAAAEQASRLRELRAKTVLVPPGDEAKPIACPVCKEILKAEFNEDDEEWVWRNATAVDGRIFHATCHADAIASASSLATRLMNGRSLTPETRSPPRVKKSDSPAPSVLSGMKRKMEEDSDAISAALSGSPPLKKAMLGSTAA
ncbi:unnamed protein product [Peniophora sp. CBMAI 1063]|nr:unnamed protein product [Peniophora sp. CBMAI 1063]